MNKKLILRTLPLLLLLIFLTLGSSARELTAEEILRRHSEATSALQDVQSKARLDLDLVLGFIPYSEDLDGRYYYLKPNKHRLEFDDAPSYFDKMPSMFGWKIPSLEKYRAKVKKTDDSSHKVLFLPKNPDSSTLSIACIFEAGSWKMLRQETSYRDGGSVNLRFDYSAKSQLPVLSQVKASVSIPSYSLTGKATIQFSQQKTNKGLSESVFKKD